MKKLFYFLMLLFFASILLACQKEDKSKGIDNKGADSVEVKETIDNKETQKQETDATPSPTPPAQVSPSPTNGPSKKASKESEENKESSPHPTSPVGASDSSIETQVVVYKGKRILELWQGSNLVGEYKIGLGFTPEGHKQIEGDGKTPEGSYYVCTRNDKSKFYLSLGLSYPSIQDAKRGLESNLITKDEHDKIESAIKSKRMPPWNTKLGGEIMIHGHGSKSDWTRGCIAVDDDIMDILWEHCKMGTVVTIYP